MTEEQIKQNADKYADKLYEDGRCTENTAPTIQEIYIAGAHSLDEEIEKLKEELIGLRSEKIQIAAGEIGKLQEDVAFYKARYNATKKELDELRNPWISVEELPIEGQDVLICLYTGSVIRNYFMSIGDIDHMKNHPECYKCWMPTPRPKGGEK